MAPPPNNNNNEQPQQPPGFFARINSKIEMAQKGYEQLVNAIIRPPRADNYTINQLGPVEFTFLSQKFRREDIELIAKNHDDKNPNGSATATASTTQDPQQQQQQQQQTQPPPPLKLQASIWTRDNHHTSNEKEKKKTMVVYLHGNASARLECLSNLSFLLAQGIFGVASLDFTGSGKSDGEYVSLGYYERYDLETLLQHLNRTYGNLEIVLWGRSMGASTALMHASHQTQEYIWKNNISNIKQGELVETLGEDSSNADQKTTTILKGLICDSPFASLPLLCEELVEKARSQGIVVPGIVVSVAIAIIARSVRKRAFFDINDISPIDHVPTLPVPALFICGADDDFIPPHHSERLIEAYNKGVRTNLLMVPGGHNDNRPEVVYEALTQFLRNEMSLTDDSMALTVPSFMEKTYIRHPPWAYKRNSEIFQAHADAIAKPTTQVQQQQLQQQQQQQPSSAADDDTYKPEELGMTKERQDDIQNKIHTMLGPASSS